jgi:hypothetical protein
MTEGERSGHRLPLGFGSGRRLRQSLSWRPAPGTGSDGQASPPKMMRFTIIIQTAAALALAAGVVAATEAQAQAQIPKQMQGKWCDPDVSEGAESEGGDRSTYVRGACEGPGFEIDVTASGFTAPDTECRALQVKRFTVYSRGRRGSASPEGPGYRIKFRCIGEEGPLIVEHDWQIEKGALLTLLRDARRSSPRSSQQTSCHWRRSASSRSVRMRSISAAVAAGSRRRRRMIRRRLHRGAVRLDGSWLASSDPVDTTAVGLLGGGV